MSNSNDELAERFVALMERLSTQRRTRSREKWADFGLTMPQARTLFYLSHGPKRMSEMAEYLDREMSSTTSMIDRLVKNDLVSRVEDASDRRVVTCELTPAGEAVVKRFFELGRMRNEAIGGMLSEEELRTVVPALQVLTDAIERGDREGTPEVAVEDSGVASGAPGAGSQA
jgi:DNA-binding MarR family transcriptional regulator